MFLDELQKRFQEMQTKVGVRAVFGEVIEVNGRKLIPVAGVVYGFGMGGGQGPTRQAKDQEKAAPPLGGGGVGGMRAEPIAIIEVTNDTLKIQPIVNVTRVAIAGLLVGAWSVFWISRAMRNRNA
jgi:uncharacterized spore protein YtfJ